MIEVFHFKNGAKIIKLNSAVTNLNVWGNLMCHCGRDKNTKEPLDWLNRQILNQNLYFHMTSENFERCDAITNQFKQDTNSRFHCEGGQKV
jgi:hypothetical protein